MASQPANDQLFSLDPETADALARQALPDWPRLMNKHQAAAYLSIGVTLLRDLLAPKKIRGRSVWDRRELDRFADALAGQPLDADQERSHAADLERKWLERRQQRKA
jgi:hypothetical protein